MLTKALSDLMYTLLHELHFPGHQRLNGTQGIPRTQNIFLDIFPKNEIVINYLYEIIHLKLLIKLKHTS